MNKKVKNLSILIIACMSLISIGANPCKAVISGIKETSFSFTVKQGHISMPDGQSILMWGYAIDNGPMQYPGPTLIVNQGDNITITLTNQLPSIYGNVSIVFPGHEVKATGGVPGLLTNEAPPDGVTSVTYTFTADQPGTYYYHSGTRPELQLEMGLIGAIIVRPQGFDPANPTAYNHPDSAYDREYLFLLSEMDPVIHRLIEFGTMDEIDNTTYRPVYWMINGRAAPDTMFPAKVPWLPHQPYNCMPRMHPGEKLLMRVINGGRDLHPFHHHGNHSRIIAKDGRLLKSSPGVGADLAQTVFTIKSIPGETVDSIFEWTGKGLGWDVYGHKPSDPLAPHEYAPDHGKPFPVKLPDPLNLTYGGFWSGSPFLGSVGDLPPGEGGLNVYGGLFYMWHSHTEKEMVNNNIFPGGMMTMMVIEPPGAPIP
ncbi:Multicopper oxidase [Dissulfuribacter thermophilus]|uniref:Multicopper oxidase n=1 Tax=Dissulfuribacter thermophilus TaxID=1156395 RepID=A0A1B9F2W0_9BACT|nr:multicopper oxidase domain-containing protein [Dissulfuribacter thermophilus]OCC14278.1 Multicopper oxidase [Dissulfuribacter thermophilus]